MTRTHTLLATTREWTDAAGKKHKVRIEVGALFLSKAGKVVVKLDAIPVASQWSGYLAAEPCAAAAAATVPSAPTLPPGRRISPGMPPPPEIQPEDSNPDEDVPF